MTRPNKSFCYEFPRPGLTVDIALVSNEKRPRVLLIKRKQEPFAGCWALPGGFVEENEPLERAARRELKEEVCLEVGKLEQMWTFADPGRDPRGWTVSVVFLGRVNAGEVEPRPDDDAAEVAWHSLAEPPSLAFDHADILAMARKRISE